MIKKLISILVTILLVTSAFSLSAFAQAGTDNSSVKDAYQEVREKLSAEFGIEVRAATDDELKKVGLSREDVEKEIRKLTPAEFEKELRKTLKDEIQISKTAKIKSSAAGISEKDSKPVSDPAAKENNAQITEISYYDVDTPKNISGGIAHLSAEIIVGSTPSPRWGSVYEAYVLSGSLYTSPPFFAADTWNYSRLDAGRTIAVNFSGYTTDKYGNYIGSATRYVEFYAFNPA